MHALTVVYAFIRRDWLVAVSYRLSIALELVALFFNLALFFFIGDLIDPSVRHSSADLQRGYFAFAALGIALFRLGQTALHSVGDRFRDEQKTGTFEPLLSTSSPSWLVIVGSASFEILRAALLSIVTIVFAVAFFDVHLTARVAPWALALASFAIALVLFTALGVVFAAFTVVFKQTMGLVAITLPALALISGVYFPVSLLPEPLRALAAISPFKWLLEVLRSALLRGRLDLHPLLYIVPVAIVSVVAALRVFGVALDHARKAGSLAQY